jgi:hypothetical protein
VRWPPGKVGGRSGWIPVHPDSFSLAAGGLAGRLPEPASEAKRLEGNAGAMGRSIGPHASRGTQPAVASGPPKPEPVPK